MILARAGAGKNIKSVAGKNKGNWEIGN